MSERTTRPVIYKSLVRFVTRTIPFIIIIGIPRFAVYTAIYNAIEYETGCTSPFFLLKKFYYGKNLSVISNPDAVRIRNFRKGLVKGLMVGRSRAEYYNTILHKPEAPLNLLKLGSLRFYEEYIEFKNYVLKQ